MNMNRAGDLLVSIIIPAYNAGDFISETINSVLNQEHKNFELLIVNDGSTDNTEEVIERFLVDKRIKYISQENRGCSAAKSLGMQRANGEFIQYLDADDLLSSDKIKEQVEALDNHRGNIAVCRTKAFFDSIKDADSQEIDSDFLYSTTDTMQFILNLYGLNGKNGMIQPNAFLISKELSEKIGPWNTSISPSPDEDGEYFCRAILAAEAVCFTKSGINYYRKRRNSANNLSRQLSYDYARGALKSLILITAHILARENTDRTRRLMAMHFANFMYLHSYFKDLSDQALNEIYSLGINKIPLTGGGKFRKLTSLIGFKNALVVKNIAKSFKMYKN
jgi:glycosyltransferase involved in cell wall biosynthesis